jgi:DNA-directed RNA polymerase specialized sigma24 family protein
MSQPVGVRSGRPTPQPAAAPTVTPPDPRWAVAACLEAARRIGHDQWQLLRLVYEHGMTQREVAQHLDIEPSTVARDIAHGLRELAAVLSHETNQAPGDSRTNTATRLPVTDGATTV